MPAHVSNLLPHPLLTPSVSGVQISRSSTNLDAAPHEFPRPRNVGGGCNIVALVFGFLAPLSIHRMGQRVHMREECHCSPNLFVRRIVSRSVRRELPAPSEHS